MQTKIIVIVAMESERKHLDVLMPGWERVESQMWPTFRQGEVVTITCGIGMVFAAAAIENAIATYAPQFVLNFGCAGAHDEHLFPGDVVIGDQVVHQGRMRFAPDGSIVPFNVGFQVPGEVDRHNEINCDSRLVKLSQMVFDSISLPSWPSSQRLVGQTERAPIMRTGTVSSGDIWLQSPPLINATHDRTGSLCEDMEAAAIGQICALHGIPFLTVKDISNSELHASTKFEGSKSELHSDELGLRAAIVLAGVIDALQGE